MFKFWKRRKVAAARKPMPPTGSTPMSDERLQAIKDARADTGTYAPEVKPLNEILQALHAQRPRVSQATGATMDSCDDVSSQGSVGDFNNLSDTIVGFFTRQTFIGHQLAALLSTHWMINKACTMPARDAVRHWFDITRTDGEDLNAPEVTQRLKSLDKQMSLKRNCIEFIRMGRVFGVRIAFFKVDSTDPKYYEKPFNLDSVTPGSYKGIVQVDPYWCAPELDMKASSQPDSMHFYEPTWWMINGKRYHRSHLVIYRHSPPPDILKPQYIYGGVPVPQLILERVYNAERTANEAPELTMTKRLTVLKMDVVSAMAKGAEFLSNLMKWVTLRNNYGVKMVDSDDSVEQIDTSLADLDAVIMNAYQLVAAAADVPATKLLGTSPKGFNASGEYEESSYHEMLESVQSLDLTTLVERHHAIGMRSHVLPAMRRAGIQTDVRETGITWRPVDSPTAAELADINLKKSQTDFQLIQASAIDGYDIRDRLRLDPQSGYTGIAKAERPEEDANAGVSETGQLQAAAPAAPTMDSVDWNGVMLITNQSYLDPAIVQAKQAIGDYTVQVSPLFVDPATGRRYRIVIDGHHSLAAARADGVPPALEETGFAVGDYQIVC